MARYLEQLNECTDPTTGDYLPIYDASAGATDKDRKVNVSKFAVLANAQTWSGAQTFAAAAATTPLTLTPAANQTAAMLYIPPADCGSGYGPYIAVSRNSNATTPSAGFIYLVNRANTGYDIWPDNTGVLRIGTTPPSNANDTSGTVVGAQTSWADLKENITDWSGAGALDAVLACRLFSYRFKADKSRRQYHGIVIRDSDRGAWFSDNDADNQIPALNERNLFGFLIAAIQAQQTQIEALRARLEN